MKNKTTENTILCEKKGEVSDVAFILIINSNNNYVRLTTCRSPTNYTHGKSGASLVDKG